MSVEGRLELPVEGEVLAGGRLRLRGWLHGLGAPIRALSVAGLNPRETALPYGFTRPDVAEELGPPAARSGFEADLPLEAGPARACELVIWAELIDGERVRAFERRVTLGAVSADEARAVSADAAELQPTGELFGSLDSPLAGRQGGEFLETTGWLVSRGAPVRALYAKLEGVETPLGYGLLREDLAASWNRAFGAEVSGFRALIPVERRAARDAQLEIFALLADGRRVRSFARALRLAPPIADRKAPRFAPSTEEWAPRGELHGVLEEPRAGDTGQFGTIHLRGWLLSRGAPIRALWLSVAGARDTRLSYGIERPEIARRYERLPGARAAGFRGVVHLGRRSSPTVELQVFAELDGGARVPCFSRTVRLHAGVEPKLRVGPILATTWTASMELLESDEPVTPRRWLDHFKRTWQAHQQRQAPPPPAVKAFSHAWQRQDTYLRWRSLNRLTPRLRARMEESARALASRGPLISVIVPVFDPPPRFLRELIDSLRAQLYRRWEACFADDASTNPEVRALLAAAAAEDARIKVVYRPRNGHIVEATNSALELASGEFIALVDHDDLLTPDALLHVAECAIANPGVDWIYTDEDKLDEAGFHYDVQFKGAWNPEMGITHNFTHHLTVLRRSLVEEVGRMRPGFEGAQELDLFLRIAERTAPERIRHVAQVAYHWRAHAASTASRGKQKRYVFDSARRAIEEAVARRGLRARPELPAICDRHELCLYQLKWDAALLAERPVTIVIPTRDRAELLRACVESLERTVDARYVKLIIVDDDSTEPAACRYLKELAARRPLDRRVVRPPGPRAGFNYSRLVNFGSRLAETPLVLHLNNDVVALERGWLEDLVGWMSIDGVGAAGARLNYPDGSVQHAGVVIAPEGGLPDHAFHHLPAERVGYLCLNLAARDVSAVTGACLLTETALYRKLGGFDEAALPIEFNDVDYCLKVIGDGRRVVYSPGATLRHLGSASRGQAHPVRDHLQFLPRWAQYRDPWLNPNLRREDVSMTPDPHRYAHASRADRPLRILLVTH
ncbi:MAG TPA: glycosyltransferase, partial [Polyangia bacterium]|nr:glycosyltransferase [Polyangia bacterium]